ncbi:hypothetical protein MLD38_030643 [Melastoma candidum]|uniref:Uncharacterized protein n=1 Tax=Melastoma candidum TaxID=119954 RepID=A0ACB9MNG5_9MYRT|nr:hypothetical protein MLD38_030643 [Melastoma candidum]
MLLCRGSPGEEASSGSMPVYLNVYDLTPVNGYAYWVGLGVYHSGVQVHGVEYAYGAHEYPSTGIFEAEPRRCEGFTFRKSLLVGKTNLGPAEVRAVMEELSDTYRGNTYHLITKNCNHFCNDACVRLTGNPIPSWVNRLARIGFYCNCVLPASLCSTKVRHHKMGEKVTVQEERTIWTDSVVTRTTKDAFSSPPSDSSRGHHMRPGILPTSHITDTVTK